jgi:calcineurin-like phosphoesterase family protein
MSKFFSADLHLGHKNIIDFCDRPFTTLDGHPDTDAMFKMFVRNFNAVMKPGDELYILGDLAFDWKMAREFLRAVPGQKFMIWGNHDPKRNADRDQLADLIQVGKDIMETGLSDGTKVVMCHYPMLRWNKGHFGSVMLHGHTHGGCTYPYPMRILDVGVDSVAGVNRTDHQKYFPWSERQIIECMRDVPQLKHHYYPEGKDER